MFVQRRFFWLSALFAVGFGIIICRAVSFHLQENEKLEKVAMRQYRTAVRESTKRGKIFDAARRELAVNVQVDSVYANPRLVTEPERAATLLSKTLGLNKTQIQKRLTSKRKFVWIKRRIPGRQAEAIAKMNLKGIEMLQESKRSYPNGKLASTVLGAVGFDAEALGGVELALDHLLVLKSSPGEYRRDARGHLYLSPTDFDAGTKLAEIELTIDKTLQYIAERALETAVERAKAASGVALVVDPMTGEILAMASSPAFDPNDYSRYSPEMWKNRAITDTSEPGSTLKVMVVAAALDRGMVTQGERFDCENGKMVIGRNTIRDTHPYGQLSLTELLSYSSNICAAKVGQRLGREELYGFLRQFGLGARSGIRLPAESPGILPTSKQWSEIQHATISFGQGVSATSLQMTMAFAVIANGGELVAPRIVKRIVTSEGEERRFHREVIRRVIRPETAQVVTQMMVASVQPKSSGPLAASHEYTVAGKTGTAQKVDHRSNGYAPGKYFSSFIGFAPVERPRLVVYVGIDEPMGASYYGGDVAAPVFRQIVEKSLHYLKVPGNALITAQQKEEFLEAPRDTRRMVATEKGRWMLPDLRGLTMREVLEAIGNVPIATYLEGNGLAVTQSHRPGSLLPAGAKLTVSFRSIL